MSEEKCPNCTAAMKKSDNYSFNDYGLPEALCGRIIRRGGTWGEPTELCHAWRAVTELTARAEKAEAELAEADRVLAIHKRDYEAHFKAHQEEMAKLQNTYNGMRARHSLELSVIEAFLFDDHDEDGELNGLPNQWYDYGTMVSEKAQMVVIERNQIEAELAKREKALNYLYVAINYDNPGFIPAMLDAYAEMNREESIRHAGIELVEGLDVFAEWLKQRGKS